MKPAARCSERRVPMREPARLAAAIEFPGRIGLIDYRSRETSKSSASRGQDKSVHVGIETMVARIGYRPVV
jgi:hypothetical protein